MSVIIGIREPNRIILAGDKRGSSKEGRLLSDSLQKVILINEHLCLATAGNDAIGTAIMIDVNKSDDKEQMTVEDFLDVVTQFYQKVRDANIQSFLTLPFCFLIAGKKKDGSIGLVAGQNKGGSIDAAETAAMIFSPIDCSFNQCAEILARNKRTGRVDYIEETIRNIAEVSKVVSSTGDKWIYDMQKSAGDLVGF